VRHNIRTIYLTVYTATVLLLATATLVVFTGAGAQASHDTTCVGKQVYPGQDIVNIAKSSPAGTTFCVHDGTYQISSRIVVQSNDRFRGLYSDGSRPSIQTQSAPLVFFVNDSYNATIAGLRVSGAVHNDSCEPDCGRGIGGTLAANPGTNLTVRDVRANGNENQGIGGTGPGLRVINSELDHNGSFDAANDGGALSAAGLKSVHSVYVENSRVHDNYWNGVWCDDDCKRFEVHDSRFWNNGKSGIHIEINTGPAVIEGNTVYSNGKNPSDVRKGGILVISSQNADVHHNTLWDNGVAILVDERWGATLRLDNISIHDNRRGGEPIQGCGLRGEVSCWNNG
jgi:hypothetical protein